MKHCAGEALMEFKSDSRVILYIVNSGPPAALPVSLAA